MSGTRSLFGVTLGCLTGILLSFAGVPEIEAQDRGIADFPKLSAETDWPWWRGPSRNGLASSLPVPTEFGPGKNVVWKTPVPGRGHSSPIVVGNLVLLTTADESQQVHSVLAFDRATGRQVWKKDVSQGGFPARNHPKNTEASPTLVSDGERVYAAFYHHDQVEAIALDLKGDVVWRKPAGAFRPRRYEYGYAASPVIYKDTVIFVTEQDGPSAITALKRANGASAWKTPRPNNISFSSPVVAHVGGRDQLLISGNDKVSSYDPANGRRLWETAGTTAATCGTLVWDGDLVFASGGYPKSETIAINAKTGAVVWKNNQKLYEQSLIVVDEYVYGLTDNGIYFCWRASDGQEMWRERRRGPVSASAVYAGGHIYWANELGTLYVIRPNPDRFDLVAENQIENDSFASPAIVGGQIFLRVATRTGNQRQETLYCFGDGTARNAALGTGTTSAASSDSAAASD